MMRWMRSRIMVESRHRKIQLDSYDADYRDYRFFGARNGIVIRLVSNAEIGDTKDHPPDPEWLKAGACAGRGRLIETMEGTQQGNHWHHHFSRK